MVETGTLVTDADQGRPCLRRICMRVVEGPDSAPSLVLEAGTAIVGSHEDCDLVVRDGHVSRRHVEVQLVDDGIRIRDLGSKNGVMYGRSRVDRAVIAPGATIQIGRTRLQFDAIDEPTELPLWESDQLGGMRGRSRPMRQLFALLARAAPSQATLLVEGETGVGKDLLARTVHELSPRSAGPFVVLDCAAVSPALLTAQLFGCRRGAFTGADEDRPGVFEAASGGTVFLNEIGELSTELQANLLSVLESRQIRRVGGEKLRDVDLRVVAASNRPMRQDVATGRFRRDLFFRLAVVTCRVPPLRERMEDVPLLVEHFLAHFGRDALAPSRRDLELLQSHPWPGNVRELRNVIERAVALSRDTLTLPGELHADQSAAAPDVLSLPYKDARSTMIERFERDYLVNLLREHDGNVSRAARAAGIDRHYVHRLIRKLGIDKSEYQP